MATLNASTATQFAPTSPDGATLNPIYTYTGGAAANDVLNVVKLPKGTVVSDIQVFTNSANAGLTLDVGFAPLDGSTADADAYIEGGDVAAAARVRANTATAPGRLAGDSHLTVTFLGAAMSAGTVLTIVPVLTHTGHA